MSCNNVQILNFNHNIVEVGSDNKLIITDNVKCNSITIPQPVTNILQINSPGPQGPAGQSGGDTSGFVTTSSFNAYTGSSVSQFAGTSSFALTASYALFAANGGGSSVDTGSFVTTSSFNTFTSSINQATQSLSSSIASLSSSFISFSGSYNTGSFTGSFNGTATTASYVLQAVSSSFASTASYALTTAGGKIISSINSNTTAGSASFTDYIYLVTGSSTVTLTLPTAISNTNLYTVKRVGTGVVSIATTSSQTIDGSASPITINTQYVSLTLVSDNANWNLI